MPISIVLMLNAEVIDRVHCSPECDGMTYCGICKVYGKLTLNTKTNHYLRDDLCIKNTGKPKDKKTGLMLDPYTKDPLEKQPGQEPKKQVLQKRSPKCKSSCEGVRDEKICCKMRARHTCPLTPLRMQYACVNCGAPVKVVGDREKCTQCGKSTKHENLSNRVKFEVRKYVCVKCGGPMRIIGNCKKCGHDTRKLKK